MTLGWGTGEWGTGPWGNAGLLAGGVTPPQIIPVDPLENAAGVAPRKRIAIRLADDGVDGTNVHLNTLRITVDQVIYVQGGLAQNGATLSAVLNNEINGYDIELSLPQPFVAESRPEVTVLVEDTVGNQATLSYFFSVGVNPRLVLVRNPTEGILLAQFNRPMLHNDDFLFPGNWIIEPVSEGAAELKITEVAARANHPEVALLRYTGGGSTYELSVASGILSQDGDPVDLEFNSVLFEVLFGSEEEPTIRLFDTVFGPVGVSQRLRTRRTMDQHVANRAIAKAMDEQFRLRLQTLDGTAGRDGRPGQRRT